MADWMGRVIKPLIFYHATMMKYCSKSANHYMKPFLYITLSIRAFADPASSSYIDNLLATQKYDIVQNSVLSTLKPLRRKYQKM